MLQQQMIDPQLGGNDLGLGIASADLLLPFILLKKVFIRRIEKI
jgi:hypothetical protein